MDQKPRWKQMQDAEVESLSKTVRIIRALKNFSQKEAAFQMGITPSTLCRLESGELAPNLGAYLCIVDWVHLNDPENETDKLVRKR